MLDDLEKSVKSLQDQMVSLTASKVPAAGAKPPGERSSPVQQVGDEVPTWIEGMELETETLTPSGDEIRPVKVREDTELVLQNAFTPLKNPDHRALRRQFLVLDMPLTMAPKLNKVMAAECVPAVGTMDQSLARLQALMLDAVGPLTALLDKISPVPLMEGRRSKALIFSWWKVLSSQPLPFWGMRLPSFQLIEGRRSLKSTTKIWSPFQRRWNQSSGQQPCCCLASHSPNRLQITWVRWRPSGKSKGKERRFFQSPPAKAGSLAGGASPTIAIMDPRGHQVPLLPRSR